MDLQAIIYNSLKDKDYDNFTKIRWIYLYFCQLFSYDMRYIYARPSMKEELYFKKVSLDKVEDFEIICYTLALLLKEALNLFGFESEIVKETDKLISHVYVVVSCDNYLIKLDPTKRHDVTRVKMNINTKDFSLESADPSFNDKLNNSDKLLEKEFDLQSGHIKEKVNKRLDEINMLSVEQGLSKPEIFFKNLEAMYEMINEAKNLKRYDDVDFYYSYLMKAFEINPYKIVNGVKTKTIEHYYVRPVVLFNRNDKTMKDIINITYVKYDDLPPAFYLLRKEGEVYRVREIFRDEALELLNQYETPICQYLLEEAARELLTNGINLT